MLGPRPLSAQQLIDVVFGAVDAWLSADVRRASHARRPVSPGELPMTLKSMLVCQPSKVRVTTRDGLLGAGVMLGGSALGSLLGVAARRAGWPVTGDVAAEHRLLRLAHAVHAVLADEGSAVESAGSDPRHDAGDSRREHGCRLDALARRVRRKDALHDNAEIGAQPTRRLRRDERDVLGTTSRRALQADLPTCFRSATRFDDERPLVVVVVDDD